MRYNLRLKQNSRRVAAACLVVMGIASLGLIFSGCSDNGLMINNDTSDDFVSFFDQPYYPDALAKRTDIVDATSKYFQYRVPALDGGVVALNENEDIEALVVIPGSISDDTTFSATVTKLVTDDGETLIIYDFGPDGLVFSKPAVLRLDVGQLFGNGAKGVDLFWLNEETNEWEYVLSGDADDNHVAYVSIEHFSSYGIKSKSSADSGASDTAN